MKAVEREPGVVDAELGIHAAHQLGEAPLGEPVRSIEKVLDPPQEVAVVGATT